jgi:hypothetical protein
MTDPSIPDDATWRAASLAPHYHPPVSNVYMANGLGVWEFTPPLTTEEAADFELIKRLAARNLDLTLDEYRAVSPALQALRDFRQLGRNAFMALTAAERDRLLYDAQTNTTIVLLALLRD